MSRKLGPPTGKVPTVALIDAVKSAQQPSWVRLTADDLLDEFDMDPSAHATELRAKAEVYEDGPEAALALADEMQRRARAGVRFWPDSDAARRGLRLDLKRSVEGAQQAAPDDLADPPVPDEFDRPAGR